MAKRELGERLLDFSADVIRLLDTLPQTSAARKIADQLLRSAMSVGANYEESKGADSRADFAHKLQISLKEMRETRYWLCLVARVGMLDPTSMVSVIREATELRAILGKSVATVRGRESDNLKTKT